MGWRGFTWRCRKRIEIPDGDGWTIMGEFRISPVVYLWGLFLVCALGEWIFLRGRDPEGKKKWGPRLLLLQLCLMASLFVALPIYMGWWLPLLFMLGFFGFLAYSTVSKSRTCEACGTVAQPMGLIKAVRFCPNCGEEVSPSPLQRRLGG